MVIAIAWLLHGAMAAVETLAAGGSSIEVRPRVRLFCRIPHRSWGRSDKRGSRITPSQKGALAVLFVA
jgi:hypothetical protein